MTDTALELFYRYGYRKISMSDIAHSYQITRPTLHASFENEEAISTSLFDRYRARKESLKRNNYHQRKGRNR
ncbi:helix-turn-helix domain-containing protein [Pseudomonas poae]|uniref:TetR/AcrR family transcriptional regulator n=1 Tax=Pseudomonas poae TaxID=200451 RepID=UPI000F4CD3AC